MKKYILHDLKVILLTLLVVAVVLLIGGYIIFYVVGYQYFAVHKVGSINLAYEHDRGDDNIISLANLTKEDVLRQLEGFYNNIQDAEEYQKLYQAVEDQDESALFVISRGAPILYFKYYEGDDLDCYAIYGISKPNRLYIYRVNQWIPMVG